MKLTKNTQREEDTKTNEDNEEDTARLKVQIQRQSLSTHVIHPADPPKAQMSRNCCSAVFYTRPHTACFVTLKRSVMSLIADPVTVLVRGSTAATLSPKNVAAGCDLAVEETITSVESIYSTTHKYNMDLRLRDAGTLRATSCNSYIYGCQIWPLTSSTEKQEAQRCIHTGLIVK